MENKYFDSARKKALHFLKDNEMLDRLLEDSRHKMHDLKLDRLSFDKMVYQLKVLIRMIRSYSNGSYRIMPWKSIVVMVAAVIYFVTPLDLIPDFIPVAGFVDDLGVLVWVFNSFGEEIDQYLEWENSEVS